MAEYFIDALGEMCPVPNIKIREKLKDLEVGDAVVLETDHSCAYITINNEMRRKGYKTSVKEIDNGIWQLTVRRVK
ncbi:sulfurtransferase TusA family protein [Moorella naiadis]|uniref:sulfurtransferase TusA family protein n=1 Tax=Moorella naiadis (nom. illeg.) TaxID=3093670 RepID=UPI003D9CB6AA